jgi:hypothetical protein
MGFLCKNNESKKIVPLEEIQKQQFLRTIGLDGTVNVDTNVNFCNEVLKSPEFYVQGATKLTTGLTTTLSGCTTTGSTSGNTFIYNLSYTPNINVNFIITGGTEYTGYTGSFCTKLYSQERFTPGLFASGFTIGNISSEILDNQINFSAITSSTVTLQLLEGSLPKTWAQYLIRPYNIFITKDCAVGTIINSWNNEIQTNYFKPESDFYFITVMDPPAPILENPQDLKEFDNIDVTNSFRQQIVLANGVAGPRNSESLGDLDYFILDARPSDVTAVMCFLNGIALSFNDDFQILDINGQRPPVLKIKTGEPLKYSDWLVLYYPVGTEISNNTTWSVDTFKVDGTTTTVDITNPIAGNNYLNYNTSTSKQEIYTKKDISANDSPVIFVNGIQLIKNEQYFISTSVANRIILTENIINQNDIISIFYNSVRIIGNDYGSLKTPEFKISWSSQKVQSDNVTGVFVGKIYDNDDTFNTVLYQQTIPYDPNNNVYNMTFSSLALNINYRFEIWFEITYKAYLNNEVKSCSVSKGYFNTQNKYINNSY